MQLIDANYEQDCARNNELPTSFEVAVRHQTMVQCDRARCLEFNHPSNGHVLVEFYLPVDGFKRAWVKNGAENIAACYMRNMVSVPGPKRSGNQLRISFLKEHKFHIKQDMPIDDYGYVSLTAEQESVFWDLFKQGK